DGRVKERIERPLTTDERALFRAAARLDASAESERAAIRAESGPDGPEARPSDGRESEAERIRHNGEARQLWFQRLVEFVEWAKESVATRTDDHLAWYGVPIEGERVRYYGRYWYRTHDGELVPDHGLTVDDIAAVIQQLERIRSITF